MGADLCGYILCGPDTLDRKRIERLRKKLTDLAEAAQVIIDENVRREKEKQDPLELDALPKRLKAKAISYADDKYGGLDDSNLDYTLTAIAEGPELLDQFVNSVWRSQYRDQMSRTMPGRKGWVIVVCGERTWGDGPEEDSAWGITEKASALGVLEGLGIR